MTRTNGDNLFAGANCSHLLQESKMREPRPTHGSGFNSFLRWFKKNEKHRQKCQTTDTTINNDFTKNDYYNSNDTLSPPSSPILDKKSIIGSSCDSVFSTATNGFAFISPDNYQPYGKTQQYEKCIAPGPVTDSYRKRLKQQESTREIDKRLELTLRRKYQLFGTESTINPIYLNPKRENSENNIVKYSDYSLPNVKKQKNIDKEEEDNLWNTNVSPKRHRRTVSDSSKDKQSGAYVHVKGKRKAPPPPPLTLTRDNNLLNNIITPASTLNRKKRKAPQPPTSPINYMFEPIFTEGLLEDKEIKAIIENTTNINNNNYNFINNNNSYNINTNNIPITTEMEPIKPLTDEQKQIVLENIIKIQKTPNTSENDLPLVLSNDTLKLEKGVLKSIKDIDIAPIKKDEIIKIDDKYATQLSPRPWYKRPLSSNREINIPFKREVVLKTMEKRKSKKEKENDTHFLPDVSFTRNSIFESASKLVFFSSSSSSSSSRDKDEKRKSGISIPSISELDREAAEIINQEHAIQQARFLQEENEKYYQQPTPPQQLQPLPETTFLRCHQNNNALRDINTNNNENDDEYDLFDEENPRKSTKELISKFEASSNTQRITVNTSFIGRTDLFENVKNKPKETTTTTTTTSPILTRKEIKTTISPILTRKTTTQFLKENQDEKKIDDEKLTKNHLKDMTQPIQNNINSNNSNNSNILGKWSCPYCTLENPNWRIICEVCEKIKPYDLRFTTGQPNKQNEIEVKNDMNVIPKPYQNPLQQEQIDWNKKAEKVKQYFKPRPNCSITTGNSLAKSASETSIQNEKINIKKIQSPSKLIGSPKLGARDYFGRLIDPIKTQKSLDETILENNYDEFQLTRDKPGLLDSKEVVVTTVTTVFQPSDITIQKNERPLSPTIDEVRNARLARFNVSSPSTKMMSEETFLKSDINTEREQEIVPPLTNQEELEKEKERLREMIRQMNARALAEKYPILKNNNLLSDENITVRPAVIGVIPKSIQQNDTPPKLGAIKKLFNRKANNDDELRENTNKQLTKTDEIKHILPIIENSNEEIFKKVDLKKKNNKQMEVNENKKENENVEINEQNEEKQLKQNNNYPIYENFVINETLFSPQENAKVEEITNKLKSKKGLDDFKATLKSSPKQLNDTSTLAINKILKQLEQAIAGGQYELASTLAKNLARMKVSLSVTRQRDRPLSTIVTNDESFVVDMFVKDKVLHKGPIQITITPSITVIDLKNKIFKDFNIPVKIQKWILNNQTVTDENFKLSDYGIKDKKSILYLYLNDPIKDESQINVKHIPVENVNLLVKSDSSDDDDASGCQNEIIDSENAGARALPIQKVNSFSTPKTGWTCPLCTLLNLPVRTSCLACSQSRPASYVVPKQFQEIENDFVIIKDELKSILKKKDNSTEVKLRPIEKKNDLNKLNVHRKSSELLNITLEENKSANKNILTTLTEQKNTNLFNPTNTNIVMTILAASPNITRNKYRGVDNFNPNSSYVPYIEPKIITPKVFTPKVFTPKIIQPVIPILETKPLKEIIKPLKTDKKQAPQPPIVRANHYMELLNLDYADVVPNIDEFECPVCFLKYNQGNGVILRDCLHIFCRECLANTIQYSDEAEIKCPYMDSDYSCESVLQEREIKALVTREIYEQHLTKSVRQAEHGIENTFHCKTPNCRGWCIYEDNVNQFKCPVCMITNCLTCQSIHDGLNCQQYQDRLNGGCDNNQDARRTKEMLQDMVDKGEAMNCPTCQVVLMKKWGCDWLRCSMCKTEICWVTRGPRWGQGGKGDTTGGCKCGVDGKKCHPKCNYCH